MENFFSNGLGKDATVIASSGNLDKLALELGRVDPWKVLGQGDIWHDVPVGHLTLHVGHVLVSATNGFVTLLDAENANY